MGGKLSVTGIQSMLELYCLISIIYSGDTGTVDLRMKGADMNRRKIPKRVIKYEAVGFLAILVLTGLDTIFDFPRQYLIAYTSHPKVWEVSLESIGILFIAITTLVTTRRLVSRLFYLEGFLRICAWCRKINHDDRWSSMEDYFMSGFDTRTTHGMCPECFKKLNPKSP